MAAAVISVPANEGISVKNEDDDPEINAMALKMKESYQKTATATLRPAGTPTSNVYINRAGRPVALPPTGVTSPNSVSKENVEKLSKDCEDAFSIKGGFGWQSIGSYHIPYILRIINGEIQKFVSVRMAETQLLSSYLHYLHADIYTCTSVKSHFILDSEAKLLNDINYKHSDQIYGKEPFISGKDFIVRLEDVTEFYYFVEICYKKLLCNISPDQTEKCGFIRINSESVVPYCIKDNSKYVPLFYFEGETDSLKHRAIKLENWNLAYLKFCCKVQGIRNELFASDTCTVTSLDDIKQFFPSDTHFEEYWPAKVVDTQLLTNQKTAFTAPTAAWIRAPPPPVVAHNNVSTTENIPHTLPAPAPVAPPPSMSVSDNTYQNGWPNQMVNSFIIQAAQPPTRGYSSISRNQNVAAQYYNASSSVLQSSNSPMNQNPPPPLIRTTPPVSSNPVTYSNAAPLNQSMNLYNQMTNNSVMSHANQLRHFYPGQRSNVIGQPQQQQVQQQLQLQQQQQQQLQLQQQKQQQQQQLQQQQQHQQIINAAMPQQTYGSQSISANTPNARVTNTQQRNALRTVTPTDVVSEIIDLSSPPSSPVPSPKETSRNVRWILKRIPERTWAHDAANNIAYKMQKGTISGKTINCINSKPYLYSDMMVTLDDLVQTVLPSSSCSVFRCAQVLNKYLNIPLYSANSEQMAVLRENGRLKSMNPDDTPLAMLEDIGQVLLPLKNYIQQYQSMSAPSKRHRTS